MALTGLESVSRLAKLSSRRTIESGGLIDQSLDALTQSEIASPVAITLASRHVSGTRVQNSCGH